LDKVILFDLDGTLIDSTDAIVGTCYHAFRENNFDFKGNDEDIKSTIGHPLEVMFEMMGVGKNRVWDFVDAYKERYRMISKEQTTLLEGAVESLLEASSFARMGVVTTKTTQFTIPLLEHLGIMHNFETLIGRQEVQNPKPHPEPIYKAMEAMGISSDTHEIWMIGDTKLDLIAAKEAKISSAGVLSGYGSKEELEAFTNAVFTNVYDAVKFIKKV
jgi:HAD superfamily hydrolase (TIGR01549 family)